MPLAMDGGGLETFLAAVTQAERHGSGRLRRRRRMHDVVIEAGAADIDLAGERVVWRLGRAIAGEIIEALTGLGRGDRPCH